MAEAVYGFTAEDVKRIRKAIEFYESSQRRAAMRRQNMPATAEGMNYVYGTLSEDLAFEGTALLTLANPVDTGEDSQIEVYGRWFSASAFDVIGATYNPFTGQWDADRKVCENNPDADAADGGNWSGGGDTADGGSWATSSGALDGGTW